MTASAGLGASEACFRSKRTAAAGGDSWALPFFSLRLLLGSAGGRSNPSMTWAGITAVRSCRVSAPAAWRAGMVPAATTPAAAVYVHCSGATSPITAMRTSRGTAKGTGRTVCRPVLRPGRADPTELSPTFVDKVAHKHGIMTRGE